MMKKCCWNCKNCCTFGGVCFKGKFDELKYKVELEEYNCCEFEGEDDKSEH